MAVLAFVSFFIAALKFWFDTSLCFTRSATLYSVFEISYKNALYKFTVIIIIIIIIIIITIIIIL